MGRRILVKGGSGAGKSTLAATLARHFDVPHVELDALHHGPDWTSASAAELRARVTSALDDARGWVVDGNYDSKLGTTILDRADLVVWLDLPLATKVRQLAGRTARRWFENEVLWNGNRETLKDMFWGREALFPWAISSHFRQRRSWPTHLRDRPVVRLRTRREADAWLVSQLSLGAP